MKTWLSHLLWCGQSCFRLNVNLKRLVQYSPVTHTGSNWETVRINIQKYFVLTYMISKAIQHAKLRSTAIVASLSSLRNFQPSSVKSQFPSEGRK